MILINLFIKKYKTARAIHSFNQHLPHPILLSEPKSKDEQDPVPALRESTASRGKKKHEHLTSSQMRSDKQKEMSGHEDDTDVSGINCKEQESNKTKCRKKGEGSPLAGHPNVSHRPE